MKKLILLMILISATFIYSCADNTAGTGTVKVLITDSPITGPSGENITEVHLNFKEVLIHVSGGWKSIAKYDAGKDIELLQLIGGITEEFGIGEVPIGKVNQIRIIFGDGNTITVNGSVEPLIIPSNKIDANLNSLNLEVESDITHEITLDVDLENAVKAGILLKDPTNGNKWTLRPVILLKKIARALDS